MRPFTEVEATLLESGWELLWDSEEDQPVEDEAAHRLITGEVWGIEYLPKWYQYIDLEAEGGPVDYRIYRGSHIRAVYVRPLEREA